MAGVYCITDFQLWMFYKLVWVVHFQRLIVSITLHVPQPLQRLQILTYIQNEASIIGTPCLLPYRWERICTVKLDSLTMTHYSCLSGRFHTSPYWLTGRVDSISRTTGLEMLPATGGRTTTDMTSPTTLVSLQHNIHELRNYSAHIAKDSRVQTGPYVRIGQLLQ